MQDLGVGCPTVPLLFCDWHAAARSHVLLNQSCTLLLCQEWDKIWTINKKLIDPVCPRHTAVEQSNRWARGPAHSGMTEGEGVASAARALWTE